MTTFASAHATHPDWRSALSLVMASRLTLVAPPGSAVPGKGSILRP